MQLINTFLKAKNAIFRRKKAKRVKTTYVYDDNPDIAKFSEDFKTLHISPKSILKLHGVFNKIDKDASGEICLWEMLDYLHLRKNIFARRIFSVMDEDGSGEIDFREFVIALWNYCTLGKAALIIFAFELYDKDGSGEIDTDEIWTMLNEVYGAGNEGRGEKSQKIMQTMEKHLIRNEKSHELVMTREIFCQIVRSNPTLLFPAFQLQVKIQDKILGQAFWESMAASRVEISEGTYISVSALLQATINKESFERLVEVDLMEDDETKLNDEEREEEKKRQVEEAKGAFVDNKFVARAGPLAQRRKQNASATAETATAASRMKSKAQKKRAARDAERMSQRQDRDSRTSNRREVKVTPARRLEVVNVKSSRGLGQNFKSPKSGKVHPKG